MKNIAPFALGALTFYACSPDDEDVKPEEDKGEEELVINKDDLLVGEWKILSVDGEPFGDNYEGYTYSVGFKFEANGDFGYCYETIYETEPSKNESYCEINGEWEWLDEEQNELKLTQFNTNESDYVLYVEIDSLTEDYFAGDFFIEDDSSVVYEVIFEKYDFEE